MADTAVDICNRALVLVRAATIDQFENITEGASTEEIACKTLYEATVVSALSSHPWSFSTTVQQLSRNQTPPLHNWDAAYQKPENTLDIQSVRINDYNIDYEIQEDNILCNAVESDEVYCDWTFRSDEAVWPEFFKKYLYYELASQFAIPCGGQEELAETMERKAEKWYARAKNRDSQSDTAKAHRPGRLVNRRRGGYY